MSETDSKLDGATPTAEAAPKAQRTKLSVQLPYLATPGSIKTAFEKIRQASTPDRVTNDFIQNGLGMKGGNGSVITPFLKKIGLVATDGAPTELYKQFRNPSLGGAAIASAIKFGYKPLASVSEYFYKMNDRDLLNVILQVTGAEANSSAAKQILSTIKALKSSPSLMNRTQHPVPRQSLNDSMACAIRHHRLCVLGLMKEGQAWD